MSGGLGCVLLFIFFIIFFIFLFFMLFQDYRVKFVRSIKNLFGPKPRNTDVEVSGRKEEVPPPIAPPRGMSVRIPPTIRRESAPKPDDHSGKTVEIPSSREVQLEEITEQNDDNVPQKSEEEPSNPTTPVSNDYIYV